MLKFILNNIITDESATAFRQLSGRDLVDHFVQSGSALRSATLSRYRDDLIKDGILDRQFASFLWEDPATQQEGPQAALLGILDDFGLAIPLSRIQETPSSILHPLRNPATRTRDEHRGCTDLLVPMRLGKQPTEDICKENAMARNPGGQSDNLSLKLLWRLEVDGSPFGFAGEVIALCHRLGDRSSTIRWRHGGLFARAESGTEANAKALVVYDEMERTISCETIGREKWDFVSLRIVVSAVRHVTLKYPDAIWTGRVMCPNHESTMYVLATSTDTRYGPRVRAHLIPRACPAFCIMA